MSGFDKDLLVRELDVRSQEVGDSSIDLAAVKRRARRMQRRRALVGGTVAAVVAAVTVPVVMTLGLGLGIVEGPTDDPTVAAPPRTTLSTTSTTERPSDDTVRLSLDGLDRGAAPRIGYLDGSELITPDARGLTLDGRFSWITPYAQGWLAGSYDENGPRLNFLDAHGNLLRGQPGAGAVVNASGSQVAYVTAAESTNRTTQLVVAPTLGSEAGKLRVPVPADATPVGFLSDSAVVYGTDGERPEVFVATVAGSERVPGLLGASDATEHGLIAGATDRSDNGSCSAVVRADGFAQLWSTCDFSFEQFSPDGRYILATDAHRDGIGFGTLAILDAKTGAVVAHYQKQDRDMVHINAMTWEDDRHVLATVYDEGEWAVVRTDTRGSIELATVPVPGPDAECPLFFSLRP